MKRREPSERFWIALKQTAAMERRTITHEQAAKRIRKIAASEGMGNLPEELLRFYTDEYVRMVRGTEQ